VADRRPTDTNDLRHEKGEGVEAFLRVALARWQHSHDSEYALRQRMLDDKKFFAGEHWHPKEKGLREQDDLPALTIDRLGQPKRQITNALGQARPSIQVNPVDSGEDVETAQAFQGLIKNIEQRSEADVVYATAADDAVIMGRGWFRINPEYCDEEKYDPTDPGALFRQDLKLMRVPNAFSVYRDPDATALDYRDANFYFITDDIPLWEYPLRFPDSDLASSLEAQGVGDAPKDWVTSKSIRVAEYYYIEVEEYEQWLVEFPALPNADGSPGAPTHRVIPGPVKLADGVTVLKKRTRQRRRVHWALINAVEVLDGNERKTAGRAQPGKYIPIVPMLGEELNIEGKVDYRGIVRMAKDPSRVYDFSVSGLVEQMQLAAKAPWLVAEGQLEGYETEWSLANRKRYAYLTYKPTTSAGQLVGAPVWNSRSADLTAYVAVAQQSDIDIKNTTGFHDPSLGVKQGDESGKAILARQRQGELGASHFAIGQVRAIRFAGQILVDMIPAYYDAPRVERILGPDNATKTVALYSGQSPAASPQALEVLQKRMAEGQIDGIYDLNAGRYDVVCSVAPSTETVRKENVETILAAIQADPTLLYVVGDILYENMDTPVGKKLAERMKKVLRPEVREQGKDGQPDPAQLAQQLAMTQQEMQALGQAYQQAQEIIRTDAQKLAAQGQQKQMDVESKVAIEKMQIESAERIASLQAQTELAKVQAQMMADERMAKLEALIAEMAREREFRQRIAEKGVETATEFAKEDDRRAHDDAREDERTAHADEREDIRFEREAETKDNGNGASA
jgi:hypothetical protein